MAESYEKPVSEVVDALTGENSGLSQATQNAISQILADLAPTEQVQIADVQVGTLTNETLAEIAPAAQVIVMGADSSAEVTFAADSPVQTMVVGGGGSSVVKFETEKPVAVQLGGGSNDSVETGAGDDTITFTGGEATINTGEGNDTVVLQSGLNSDGTVNAGVATVRGGSGSMTIQLQSMDVSAEIDAGAGFDRINVGQDILDMVFRFVDGKFRMHHSPRGRSADDAADGPSIGMENVNVVTFGGEDDGTADAITVLANSQGDAIVASLYKVALGRYGLDAPDDGQLGGIEFWVDQFDQSNEQHLVYSFLNCDEFHSKYDNMSATEYVQALFDNLGAANGTTVTTVAGKTVADFAATITDDPVSRYDVAWTVATSEEAINILGQDGANYFVDGFSA